MSDKFRTNLKTNSKTQFWNCALLYKSFCLCLPYKLGRMSSNARGARWLKNDFHIGPNIALVYCDYYRKSSLDFGSVAPALLFHFVCLLTSKFCRMWNTEGCALVSTAG